MPIIGRTFFSIVLCAAAVVACAQSAVPRAFDVPGHGKLTLAVPAGWQVEVEQPSPQQPTTLDFSPRAGAPFHVMITALRGAPPASALPDPAGLRDRVAEAAKAASAESVESTVVVKPLPGPANPGYYFTATDRAPKPGEFKYLTQGLIRIGRLDAAFSVLTNDGQDAVIMEALDMLHGASYKPPTI